MKRIIKYLFILLVCYPTSFFVPIVISAQEITEIKEAGTYKVDLWDETGTEKTTINVTVLYPRTVRSIEYSEAIDAYDVEIPEKIFQTLSDTELIYLTKARAWSTLDGTNVPVFVKEKIVKDKENGWYQVIFSTNYGTQTTINVLENKKLNETSPTEQPMYLNFIDFTSFTKITGFLVSVLLVPLFLLLCLYFYIQKRVGKMKELLDK